MLTYVIRSGKPSQADYTPYGGVRKGFLCKDPEVVLSGPRDTGKTMGILFKLHCLATKYPQASIVIARKQLTDTYSTVLQTYEHKVLTPDEPVLKYGGGKAQWFDYPNGARIWAAGLDKPGKVLSAEHDIIYINQAEEVSLLDWEAAMGSVTGRAGHMPYAQIIGDCNPGPPTHWIRQRAKTGSLTFIPTTHRDNPDLFDPLTGQITPEGHQRLGRLKSLTGTRYQRWFLGLWVAPEGAIYSIFDEEVHKVRTFTPPPLWPRFVGIDPVGAYVAAVWVALDPATNILNVYREYYAPYGVPTKTHATNILQLTGYKNGRPLANAETIFYWVVGAKTERQFRTDFQSHGIPGQPPAVTDVWAGIDRIIALLDETSLLIHDSCPGLLSEIGDYRRTLKDGVPTENIENKDEYHLLDALRYAVVGPEATQGTIVHQPARIGAPW